MSGLRFTIPTSFLQVKELRKFQFNDSRILPDKIGTKSFQSTIDALFFMSCTCFLFFIPYFTMMDSFGLVVSQTLSSFRYFPDILLNFFWDLLSSFKNK